MTPEEYTIEVLRGTLLPRDYEQLSRAQQDAFIEWAMDYSWDDYYEWLESDDSQDDRHTRWLYLTESGDIDNIYELYRAAELGEARDYEESA